MIVILLFSLKISLVSAVDGHCLSWGSWSACSVTCGTGNKTRTRNCTEPQFGGKVCTCSKKDSQSCKVIECPSKRILFL